MKIKRLFIIAKSSILLFSIMIFPFKSFISPFAKNNIFPPLNTFLLKIALINSSLISVEKISIFLSFDSFIVISVFLCFKLIYLLSLVNLISKVSAINLYFSFIKILEFFALIFRFLVSFVFWFSSFVWVIVWYMSYPWSFKNIAWFFNSNFKSWFFVFNVVRSFV